MNDDLQLQNALGFLTGRIIPSWQALAAMDGYSEPERQLILAVPAAIARLPHVDEEIKISAEIGYYWEDKNWVGRLRYMGGELELRSVIFQEEGPSRELCAQWQHTATKISSIKGLERHDPGHLWYWAECFSLFVKACRSPGADGDGQMALICEGRELRILTCSLGSSEEQDELES